MWEPIPEERLDQAEPGSENHCKPRFGNFRWGAKKLTPYVAGEQQLKTGTGHCVLDTVVVCGGQPGDQKGHSRLHEEREEAP